ncbi:hypothetical protein [Sphingomonas pokkalii]|uniref:Uncharacterized protein n=1 Tax=Sphingomonas pokkalii TaxID=2175090 RepID=A0A2U0SGL1_9SPHN|nr:hypothetical protein [Sphingomonas pokkalii]PVX30508.1 hypothetical protein DD559_15110 [Sphingomonas pokkalii]
MDYSAEKIDLRNAQMAEIGPMIDGQGTTSRQGDAEPLKGVLVGLVLSVPIWAVAFLAFKLF